MRSAYLVRWLPALGLVVTITIIGLLVWSGSDGDEDSAFARLVMIPGGLPSPVRPVPAGSRHILQSPKSPMAYHVWGQIDREGESGLPGTFGAPIPQRQFPPPTGTLQGTVRWNRPEGSQPADIRSAIDPNVCGRRDASGDPLVADQGGGVNNVIVALVDVPVGAVPPPEPGRLLLDNIDCRFSPHVTTLTVGSLVEIRNSDPILHLVHFSGPKEANVAFPFRGMTVNRTLEKAGVFTVKCDVHSWMQAFIRVDHHSFHAVTDRSGWFRITDVPAGEYTLEAWHETLGTRQRIVHVQGGEISTLALQFSEPVR